MDENEQYRRAVKVLRQGGIVALPTDTVYGLVAVAADGAAVERVYEAKRRDPTQPMPLFVASVEQAELIAELSPAGRVLADKFWPGPLTIVLRKRPSFETRAAAGGDSVGVRVPADAALREMAAQIGPLTGTSANVAGQPEACSAADVRAQLGDAPDLIVETAARADGVTSTVVDCSDPPRVRVLRAGAVSRAAIVDALAGVAEVS